MKALTLLGIRRSGLLLFMAIVLPFIATKPLTVQIIVGIGVLVSWLIGKSEPKLNWIFFSLASIGAGVLSYIEFTTLKGIAPAVTLLTLLGLVQSFDLKKIKDFTLFIVICELILLSQLLEEYSLWYGVYIIFVSLFLFLLLARFHKLLDSKEGQGSLVRRKLIRKIFLYSMPLTLGLFIVFPRLPIGNLFSMSKRPAGVTGFSSRLRPGEMEKIVQDDSIYFRAKIKQELVPMPLLYWRGGVLSLNKGFDWDKGLIARRVDRSFFKETLFDYEVRLSNLESSPYFHLKGTKKIKSGSPGQRRFDPGGVTFFHPYGNNKTKYRAEFSKIDKEWLVERDKKKYLQVASNISKEVKLLALELKQDNADNTFNSIINYFRKNKFSYTLSPGKQNIDGFLFSNKKGFCEHFASSTALILRLSGVPSRIVTGFHGGLYNPSGGYYQVRGQDAHAWLEYWNGSTWKHGDPTEFIAPERINYGFEGLVLSGQLPNGMRLQDFIGEQTGSALSRIIFAWDSFYNNLNQKFLEYDYAAQRDLFNFSKLRRYTGIILFSLCVLLLVFMTYLWQRGLRVKLEPLDKAYMSFLKRLEKAGIQKEIDEGALSLEKRLPRSWSDYSTCCEILQIYREVKYAQKSDKLDQFLTKTKLFRPAKID